MKRQKHRRCARPVQQGIKQCQRGASLLEALIGFAVVTLGLIGSAQWQQRLRQAADQARQQALALQAAQDELDTLRTLALRGPEPGSGGLPSRQRTVPAATGSHSDLVVEGAVLPATTAMPTPLSVAVRWLDTRGQPQDLQLAGAVLAEPATLALALVQAPAGRHASPRAGRHAAIPDEAVERPDGRWTFKPHSAGTEVWLFDRRTGRIVGLCEDVPSGLPAAALDDAALNRCTPADALLVSGRVRHAPGAVPDAAHARASPPALEVRLSLSSPGHPAEPRCLGEAVRLMAHSDATRPRSLRVPETAAAAVGSGLEGWADTGERWWQFHCAVPRAAPPRPGVAPAWSGRLVFQAIGWTIGTVPGSRRICRYSADTDGSGAIDRPAESPALLQGVDEALTGQHFLIVDGGQPCPSAAGPAVLAGGALPWSQANPATVPHQP